MVLREIGVEKGMRSTMYQALRERRQEIEIFRVQRGMVPGGERGQGQGVGRRAGQSNGSGGSGMGGGSGVVGKTTGAGGGREGFVSLI